MFGITQGQELKQGEPVNINKSIQNRLDSLSKISGKSVISYSIETYADMKVVKIFFYESGKLEKVILETTSSQSPLSGTNRTINSVSDTIHRRVFSKNN